MPSDVSAAPPSATEVVSFLGKTVGAGAALTAAVYLLRKVCLIMAWKSGGASHAELVNNLRKNGIIKSDKVYEVMLATDRAHFSRCNPYMDSPQSIGYQATISAPHMLSSLPPPSTPTPWSFYTTSCMREPKLWTWAPAVESCPPALLECGRRANGPHRGSALRCHPRWCSGTQCPPSSPGPVEARRPADSARRPGGGEPDAGAVRQVGGRQHQNEAADGSDLCAFNGQRQAVVQVEVTSPPPPRLPLPPPLTVERVKWDEL
ncbi:protein-L-isoaspartate(D-aspartate) O-methyltransferase isoform 3-T4 [Spinachia spinachia]